jgi:dTDP-4-dehydrorhamnose 3,5-epimerase
MEKIPTKIRDAWLSAPKVFTDARGFFLESRSRQAFRQCGLDFDFVQDNHCRSVRNVLRGLHHQAGDAAQGKLVWVTSGAVFDVLVDLRKSSPNYGVWDGCMLTAERHQGFWVPPAARGFADLHSAILVASAVIGLLADPVGTSHTADL